MKRQEKPQEKVTSHINTEPFPHTPNILSFPQTPLFSSSMFVFLPQQPRATAIERSDCPVGFSLQWLLWAPALGLISRTVLILRGMNVPQLLLTQSPPPQAPPFLRELHHEQMQGRIRQLLTSIRTGALSSSRSLGAGSGSDFGREEEHSWLRAAPAGAPAVKHLPLAGLMGNARRYRRDEPPAR